jgi:pilus assembly protein CpaB
VTGVPVVVAAQAIPARTVLTDSMITVKQVPENLKIVSSFADNKLVVGKITKSDIATGEQVLSTKLTDNSHELGFSGNVPEGMRAVAISVTEVSAGGGLIQPGDAVDVIGVFQLNEKGAGGGTVAKADGDATSRVVASTLLQDVTLLAMAQQSVDPSAQKGAPKGSSTKSQPDARSVTLAVTPEDAERLTLADQMGTLRLTLHRFNDHDSSPINAVDNTLVSLFGGGAPAPRPTAQATPAR